MIIDLPTRTTPGRSVTVSLPAPDFVLIHAEAKRLNVSAGRLIESLIQSRLQVLRGLAAMPTDLENIENPEEKPA